MVSSAGNTVYIIVFHNKLPHMSTPLKVSTLLAVSNTHYSTVVLEELQSEWFGNVL